LRKPVFSDMPVSARAKEHTSAEKVLSAMRQGFGGHIEASPQGSSRKGEKA
jgi:6-phosphogluconate dehydrogenase (decarboxylating)